MLVAVSVVTTVACDAGRDPPAELVDGSRVAAPLIALDTGTPLVWTKGRMVRAARGQSSSMDAGCEPKNGLPRNRYFVARVGVMGASITRRATAQHLLACDSGGPRENDTRWCGRSHGRIMRGRLDDPRLDLGCFTDAGEQIAFAWLVPGPRTTYVVVDQEGFAEVYPVIGELPVRIASTRKVDLAMSSATFDVSEYDASGRFIRSSTLRASVAG